MVIDLLIVYDDKDDLKRYIGPIETAFRYVNKRINIERTLSRFGEKNDVPKANRILFLLSGKLERAERVSNHWQKFLDKTGNRHERYFAVTVDETSSSTATRVSVYRSEKTNIVVVENIDSLEHWLPCFIRKFFVVDEKGENIKVNIYNMSQEYALSSDIEKSVKNIFSSFGFAFKSFEEASTCLIIIRSGLISNQQISRNIRNVYDRANAKQMNLYCISTQSRSFLDNQDICRHQVFGRPDILHCIIMTLLHSGIIHKTYFKRHVFRCYKRCKLTFFGKLCVSVFVVLMHCVYMLSILPLAYIIVGMKTLSNVTRGKCDDECHDENDYNAIPDIIVNAILTAIWLGLIWGLNWGVSQSISIAVTILVVFFYIGMYTIIHLCLLKYFLGYEWGLYDLPWILWEK